MPEEFHFAPLECSVVAPPHSTYNVLRPGHTESLWVGGLSRKLGEIPHIVPLSTLPTLKYCLRVCSLFFL